MTPQLPIKMADSSFAQNFRAVILRFLAWTGLSYIPIAFFKHFQLQQFGDPDYYYHLGLSRLMVEKKSLWLNELPSFPTIGWDRWFVDKELLFHVFTSKFYQFLGEKGLQALPYFFLFCTLALILEILLGITKKNGLVGIKKWGIVITSFFPIILCNGFIFRLQLVRPHTLAIPLFCLILYTLIFRRQKLAFFAGLLFSLAYHAIYIPIFAIAFFMIPGLSSSEPRKKVSLLVFAGLLFGLFIHPHFPGNIEVMLHHLQGGALHSMGGTPLSYGVELYPKSTLEMFNELSATFFIVLISLAYLFSWLKKGSRLDEGASYWAWLSLPCLLYFCMYWISPRAIEYLIPVTSLVLCGLLIETLKEEKALIRWATLAGLLISLAPMGLNFHNTWQRFAFDKKPIEANLAATAAIPHDLPENKRKVFLPMWDLSPYVFASRPDLKMDDLLDPTFLYYKRKDLHEARVKLDQDLVLDPYGMLKFAFGAHFVYSNHALLNEILEQDYRFKRIFPKSLPNPEVNSWVYELKDEVPPLTIKHYEAIYLSPERRKALFSAPLKSRPEANSTEWQPAVFGEKESMEAGISLEFPYVDLMKVYAQNIQKIDESSKKPEMLCFWVRPSKQELVNHTQAEFLGIGGGPNIRLWINGKPFYQNRNYQLKRRLIGGILPLNPGEKLTSIEALICSDRVHSDFADFSISLLTHSELEAVCNEKDTRGPAQKAADSEWPYSSLTQHNCLAPVLTKNFGKYL